MKYHQNEEDCNGANFDTIKTVYSHPQGFAQCQEFLQKHPEWKLVECSSTTAAAKLVEEKGSAENALMGL